MTNTVIVVVILLLAFQHGSGWVSGRRVLISHRDLQVLLQFLYLNSLLCLWVMSELGFTSSLSLLLSPLPTNFPCPRQELPLNECPNSSALHVTSCMIGPLYFSKLQFLCTHTQFYVLLMLVLYLHPNILYLLREPEMGIRIWNWGNYTGIYQRGGGSWV